MVLSNYDLVLIIFVAVSGGFGLGWMFRCHWAATRD